MLKARHIAILMTTAASALLGALLFLVLASYLALPCLVRDTSQFQDVGAPNSCSEHDIFKPQADLARLFKSVAAETPFRLPIVPAAAAFCLAAVWCLRSRDHALNRKQRRARTARLPFSTADPPKLPYFAALRDA